MEWSVLRALGGSKTSCSRAVKAGEKHEVDWLHTTTLPIERAPYRPVEAFLKYSRCLRNKFSWTLTGIDLFNN